MAYHGSCLSMSDCLEIIEEHRMKLEIRAEVLKVMEERGMKPKESDG
jgi:hypothetical protein